MIVRARTASCWNWSAAEVMLRGWRAVAANETERASAPIASDHLSTAARKAALLAPAERGRASAPTRAATVAHRSRNHGEERSFFIGSLRTGPQLLVETQEPDADTLRSVDELVA